MPIKANTPSTNIPRRNIHGPKRIDAIMTATCPIKITSPCLLCARTNALSFLRMSGMMHRMERYDKTAKLFPSRTWRSSGGLNCGFLLVITDRRLPLGQRFPPRGEPSAKGKGHMAAGGRDLDQGID